MDEKLHEVCKELDDISMHILSLMEQLVQTKVKLEELMKAGFIDIAKARYIMGNKSVSSLQLPTEFSTEFAPQSTVTSATDEILGQTVFKLSNMSLNIVNDIDGFCVVEPNKVRRRKGETDISNQSQTLVSDDSDDDDDDDDEEQSVKVVDPIKWFGVLVPQNLRRAQTCFRTTLQLVVEAANTQSELTSCQEKYKQLLLLKTTLLA